LVLLPSDAREAVSPDRTVALGIRPEDVRVATDEEADVELVVTVVEPRGDVTYVTAGEAASETRLTVDGTHTVTEGSTVGLSFPHDSVYLFDGESGSLVWTEKRPEQEQLTTV
jgi:ABC-type sugar transport system ATPase subunit